MIINADLHLHSKYSGATSTKMELRVIAKEAKKKGVELLGTGDCLHPQWLAQIKEMEKVDEGTFELENTRFILQTEVEDPRRVHHLILFPSLSAVEGFIESILGKAQALGSDGRPKLYLSGIKIAELASEVEALIGPSHAFTPWTALYAYHDNLPTCYGALTRYVSFLELGLSADSDYADKIAELKNLTFLTNSDAHSPQPVRLAREFNRLEVEDVTFSAIRDAILRRRGKVVLNVGLPPQEGKYNESTCIKCYQHYLLAEANKNKWRCTCGGVIKKGVRDRVAELADYSEPKHPPHRPPYLHLIPLAEMLSKALGCASPFTKKVFAEWHRLIKHFGNEVKVLVDADVGEIERVSSLEVADAVEAFRNNKVKIRPGGGGRYGEIVLPTQRQPINAQRSLLDYCCVE